MQLLGLDYSSAIKSTDDFIKKIDELDKRLASMGEGASVKAKVDTSGLNEVSKASEKIASASEKASKSLSDLSVYSTEAKLSMTQLKQTTESLKTIDKDRAKDLRASLNAIKEQLENQEELTDETVKQFNAIKKIVDIESQIALTESRDTKRSDYEASLNAEQQKLVLKNKQKIASIELLAVEQEVDGKVLAVVEKNKEIVNSIGRRVQAGQELSEQDRKALELAETELNLVKQRIDVEKTGNRTNALKEEKRHIEEISVARQLERTATMQQKAERRKLNQNLIEQIKNERQILETIQRQVQESGRLTEEQKKQVAESKAKLDGLQSQVNIGVQDMMRKSTTFNEELQRRIGWFVSGQLWFRFVEGAKEGVRAIKEIEMGMVELSRVMNDVNFDTIKFRDDLMQLGQEFGFTFEEMQPIALRWAQSGYDASETLELTRNSLLALNVAELDARQSTESLIAIMQQWNLEAKDSEMVIDKINITADNFAVTSQDLVDGLMKSSSAARNMNVTFDELLGLLTATKEASGATGKEVGNALKSIMAYVQRDKSIDTLAEVGIDVFADKAKTQFKSVLDIFKEIHAKWDTLSTDIQDGLVKSADDAGLFNEELATALDIQEELNDLQKRDISQASAGVFRRNYFVSLIENISQAEKVMENLQGSIGYSAKENAETMDTMIKKSKQVQNSWQQFILTLGDSGVMDAIKVMIDGANTLLEVINKIPTPVMQGVTSFMIMQGTIKGLTVITRELKSAMNFEGISKVGGQIVDWVLPAKKGLEEVNESISILDTSIKGTVTGTIKGTKASAEALQELGRPIRFVGDTAKGTAKSVDGVSKAIGESGEVAKTASIGLGSWISAGLTVISVGYSIYRAIKAYNEEAKRAIIERRQELKESQSEYDTMMDKYEEFIELERKASSATATQEDRRKLRDLQRELAESYEGVATAIDAEGQLIVENSEIYKEYIELKKEELELNRKKVYEDYDNALENRLKERQDIIDKLQELKERREELKDKLSKPMKRTDDVQQRLDDEETYKAIIKQEDKLSLALNKVNQELYANRTTQLKYFRDYLKDNKEFAKKLSKAKQEIIEANIKSGDLDSVTFENLPKYFESIDAMSDKTAEAWAKILAKSKESTKELQENAKAIADTYEVLDEATVEANRSVKEHLKTFDEANNIYRDGKGRMLALSASQLEMSLEVQRLAGEYNQLNKIQEELNDTGKLTSEQMEILKKIFPDLADATGLEEQAIIDLVNTAVQGFDKYVMASMNLTNITAEGSNKRITMIQKELEAWLGLVTGIGAVNNALDDNVKAVDMSGEGDMALNPKYNKNSVRQTKVLATKATVLGNSASEAKVVLEDLIETFKHLTSGANGASGAVGGASKASKGHASAVREENKALQDALKTLEQRKKLEEETFVTAKRDLEELIRIRKEYAKTYDEQVDLDVRIMEQERRFFDLRLQFSKDWIEEQKRLRIMNTQDEIDAWERIKYNQAYNIEAMKEAEIKLYELRNKLRDEQIAKEERYINLIRNVGLTNTQDEIDLYENMYAKFEPRNQEEQFSRIENLYKLYHTRVDETFKDIDKAHNDSINEIERRLKNSPLNDQLKDLEMQRRELVKLQKEADKLKDLQEIGKRLRALRNEAEQLGMDTRGLFAELPKEYLNLLDGELTGMELLENAHKARLKFLEEEAKRQGDLKQKEIDDIERQIKAIEDLEKAENKRDKLAKLKEELAYWRVRTSEEARKKVKELEEQINKFEKDDKRETEKDKLKSTADRLKDEKRKLDDDFRDKKKRLEDEYNVERRVKEEIDKLGRNERDQKIRYQLEMLDSRKNALEEEKRMIEERAKEEIEFRRNQYEQLKNGFNEHATQIVALAGTLSKDAYNEWMQNYVIPLQNAVSRGDFAQANDINRRGNEWLAQKDRSNREYFSRPNLKNQNDNREIYNLVQRIVQLKADWGRYREQGNEKAAQRANMEAIALRKQLARYNPSLAQQLEMSNYEQARRILMSLPRMHTGGKTLSYGAVYMKPGELVFPPNLSRQLEQLIGVVSNKDFSNTTSNNNQKTTTINIDSILKTDNVDFRDKHERDSFDREIVKTLKSLRSK